MVCDVCKQDMTAARTGHHVQTSAAFPPEAVALDGLLQAAPIRKLQQHPGLQEAL